MPQTIPVPHLRTVLLVAAVLLTGWRPEQAPQHQQQQRPPDVTVAPACRASVPVMVELPGRTSAYRIALKRELTQGADVRARQRLYQINPAPFRATLSTAQASLDRAQANVVAVNAQARRYQQLAAAQAISTQEYDNAVSSLGQTQADVAAGKASVQTANINLGYTDVNAPIAGRAGIALVTEGAYVQPGAATLMTTVLQIDPIYVDFSQSSVQGLRLRRDMTDGRGPAAPWPRGSRCCWKTACHILCLARCSLPTLRSARTRVP